ncbi:MAG TPA: type VI secretion system membrane subunit TssM [Aquabacterium sp.]|nr:type VI secretion system membrane subunit TssM [Aquabacterium sp.]
MMQRVWQWLLDPRVMAVLGVAALAAFLFVGAETLKIGLIWAAVVLGSLLALWAIVWGVRRWQARRAGQALEQAMAEQTDKAVQAAPKERRDEVAALRERMNEAVSLIKGSRLGQTTGSAALYELPWYVVIGNPAAGKSSAVVKSGLTFPFADSADNVIQGIGGTRHCDWFFTTEGILLDTAGRYSVHEEDRDEWFGFLSLLKKHRSKAPINGIVIAVSLAELGGKTSDFTIGLARKLRQRVQELTEKLEVFAPVYVVFTKADLIAGFAEFFEDRDRQERDQVWGATLPYDPSGKADAVAQFDRHFDELYEGLKDASVARMSMQRGEQLPPGVLTFPLEFAAIKPSLRTFLTTLFEENPYQFRPIFRGFYFTSAVQEGHSTSRASERVAQQFSLKLQEGTSASVYAQGGFFLKELFSKVIFADRQLVQQYTSRHKLRWRLAGFVGGVVLLGALLGGWTWSYLGNRQLVANVQADLVKAQRVQEGRVDLQSRIEALELLQDRLEQLQSYRQSRPWTLGLGLYQGEAIEAKLRQEYFSGLQAIMLLPTTQAIAAYLTEVNAHADQLKPIQRESEALPGSGDLVAALAQAPAAAGNSAYTSASSTNVSEAYNALKAYLMLGDRGRLESGHMSDQLTRFWRTWLEANRGTMPREQLIQSAERIMAFSLAQMADPAFPQQDLNLALLDQTRENLRKVVKGMPARERVYAEIKARAATRFAPMTVARLVADQDRTIVAGSHAISGTFTREAWDGYIKEAIQNAANDELQSTDWVLKTAANDDLTLEGSPEQIQKSLTQLYKTEYVREWQKFMQGITIQEFASFDKAVVHMNRLGDPAASPVGRLMQALYDQTSWDNPSLLNEQLAKGQQGFLNWFKQSILRMKPSRVDMNVNLSGGQTAIPMGPIGREFESLTRLMMARDSNPTLMSNYLQALSKIRTRFNQMKTQGDPGPASRQLMQQTLEGNSELAEALKLVDEQLLNGVSDSAKATLRPLLVRPLMQAFGVLVRPTEAELNRVWTAQVFEPYQQTLARKYPFDRSARVEASPAEIAKLFGSEGAVAKFVDQSLGALVVRRGDVLSPKTWADMGVRLLPEFTQGLSGWVASAGSEGGGSAGGGAAAAPAPQTVFQLLPQAASGLTEYTIEVDGQQLRYRNTQASWAHFVWPGPGTPGVRISGLTYDGRTVEFFAEAGRYGLEKMINAAQRRRLEGDQFELRWPQGNLSVAVQLRIISNAAPAAQANTSSGAATGPRPEALPARVAGATAMDEEAAQVATSGAASAPVPTPMVVPAQVQAGVMR